MADEGETLTAAITNGQGVSEALPSVVHQSWAEYSMYRLCWFLYKEVKIVVSSGNNHLVQQLETASAESRLS